MKIFIATRFLNLIGVDGICLWPIGIFASNETIANQDWFINHESIHWRQQQEMLGLFFYLWYLIEWLIRLPFGAAYYRISFEREAYANQWDKEYLLTRKSFNWLNYI